MTSCAQRASERMIMGFTVRESIVLKECPVIKRRVTFLANKTVRMPLENEKIKSHYLYIVPCSLPPPSYFP